MNVIRPPVIAIALSLMVAFSLPACQKKDSEDATSTAKQTASDAAATAKEVASETTEKVIETGDAISEKVIKQPGRTPETTPGSQDTATQE